MGKIARFLLSIVLWVVISVVVSAGIVAMTYRPDQIPFDMQFISVAPWVTLGGLVLLLVMALIRTRRPIVIAVDGTAASGKGTLAKRLAAHFQFAHLDTGSLYRLVALMVLEAGGNPANETDAVKAAKAMDPARRGDPALRTEAAGQAAAVVAKIPAVRAEVHRFQIAFIKRPSGNAAGAVVDGRDIGTVIAPKATAKLYVDATPEVRAHRRWLELQRRGIDRSEAEVLAEIKARDAADMSRAVSPLKRAEDAALLDTSEMDIDAAFVAALALVRPAVENALRTHAKG